MEKPLGSEGQWIRGLVQWEGHPSKDASRKLLHSYFNINQISGIRKENEDDFLLWLNDGTTVFLQDCKVLDDLKELNILEG